MSDRATTVIPLPLSVVESNIWDVTSWAAFLGPVDWIERSAHERYVFGVKEGRRVHEIPVAVRWYSHDHRVVWRELAGPAWRGEIRLTPMNGRRTRVMLAVAAHPRTMLGNVADMLGRRRREPGDDLLALAERLAEIPQPFNPGRLVPTRAIGGRPAATTARTAQAELPVSAGAARG